MLTQKTTKAATIVVIALLLCQLLMQLFVFNPALKDAIETLDETQQHLENAKNEIHRARESVDSLKRDVLKFNNYVLRLQAEAELSRKEREIRDVRFKGKRDSIQMRIDSLRAFADTLHLPEIEVYDSRKN